MTLKEPAKLMWLMELKEFHFISILSQYAIITCLRTRFSESDERPSTSDDLIYEVLFGYVGKKVRLMIFRQCAIAINSYR